MTRSIRVIKSNEIIVETTTFAPTHGAWSYVVLEGEIEILDIDHMTYHLALKPASVVMVYRHNEAGIQFARLYVNPDEKRPVQQAEQNKRAMIVDSQYQT